MTTDFVIWVKAKNGNKYYVDNNFNLIRDNGNLTFEEFKKNAKQYSEKSYKRIFTILHKRYPEISTCNAGSLSLYFERQNTYIKENIQYVILN
jgi:hypothetical protein